MCNFIYVTSTVAFWVIPFRAELRTLSRPRHILSIAPPNGCEAFPQMPDLSHEIAAGYGTGIIVCGVDEVGRGPLAGPVVAAAAVLPPKVCRRLRQH